MSDNVKNTQDSVAEIETAIGRTEAFIEKYQKQLIYAVVAIVLVVCGILLFRHFYLIPQEMEAQDQVAKGERYLAADSFQLALNGDGVDYIGFSQVVEDYGMTESANLASAYAAICSYKMGNYQKAIDYAEEFDGNGDVNVSVVINGLMGDAYAELGKKEDALNYYKKAYDSNNEAFSPLYLKKAGIICESDGDFTTAIELYTKIKNQYFQSGEAQDIDKYIERAKLKK